MTESETRARDTYARLGAAGLAARTTNAWDRLIVERLLAMSLGALARSCGIECAQVSEDDWAGRPRRLFRFRRA